MEQIPLSVDLADIEENIRNIEISTVQIKNILHRLMSSSDKIFEVYYKDKDFNFIYPTTPEEKEENDALRHELIDSLLRDCFIDMINNPEETNSQKQLWTYIKLFASGADPLDFQIEKIELNDIYDVVDADGNIIKSLPLNIDAYHVKQELEDVKQDKDLAIED